jgi:hypothetical protein
MPTMNESPFFFYFVFFGSFNAIYFLARVARWFVFIPKIPILVNFIGP